MTPGDFLRAVWPMSGPYCVAYPFTPRDSDKTLWKHTVVASIKEAEAYALRERNGKDIYFAVFSLRQPEVWDPDKLNYKTGERGAKAVRTHANMLATKAYFFDIDVGPTKDYTSQAEALAALKGFVEVTGLPFPMLVSSGGGFHVYWLVDKPLATDAWLPTALQLKQLAEHHGLKVDKSRTTDISSVLRVPGTFNLKDRTNPRAVKVMAPGAVTDVTKFQQLVSDAVIHAGVTVQAAPRFPGSAPSAFGESNLSREYDGPATHVADATKACAQLRAILATRGNCDEPAWYHGVVGICAHMRSDTMTGDQLVHFFSAKYPGYRPAETDAKIAQHRGRTNQPTSCRRLAEVSPLGVAGCAGCAAANDPGTPNPLVATRKTIAAPPPVIPLTVGEAVVREVTIPDPPAPYLRLKDGGIARKGKNGDGDEITEVIYPYDLHPVRRLVNLSDETEQQVWAVALPREGKKEFRISAHALYDPRKFMETISHQGIYPHKSHVPYLQDYMVAYISELQKLVDPEAQSNHLGWTDDNTRFVLPDKIICKDGTVLPATLGHGAARSSASVKQAGTLEAQVELLKFWAHPKYVAQQYFILNSLASVLFGMTGYHGVIVNASGPAGAAKSTTLYTAASLWGEPEAYPINGTQQGATVKARNERVTVLANLPVCVDEITHIGAKDATDLAMGITQPGHRLRLTSEGVERKHSGAHKATIMLTTANSSLHGLLSTDNTAGTAGSMRVLELEFAPVGVHTKPEADEFMRQLRLNYGHIGPAFVAQMIPHYDRIKARVHEVMREVDELAQILGSERFWSGDVAATVVTAEISRALGLLHFDRTDQLRFGLAQIERQRGVVVDEYTTPAGLLADYLETINASILRVDRAVFGGRVEAHAKNAPHGALLGHYDIPNQQMLLLKTAFKDYCLRRGANASQILAELNKPTTIGGDPAGKVILSTNARRTLGAGTDFAKTQSWCFIVDMTHPLIVCELPPDLVDRRSGKPDLKVVS